MPRGKEPIDFESLTKGYNKRHKTSYSQTEFLKKAYKKNKGLLATAEWLGVSVNPLRRKMDELNISVRKQTGGYHGGPTLQERFLKIPKEKLAQMTSREIQEEIGAGHITSVLSLTRKYNIAYRKYKKAYKRDSPKRNAIISIPVEKLSQMSVHEISKQTGASANYVWATLRKQKLKCKPS